MGWRGRILFLTLLIASAVQTTTPAPANATLPLPGLAGRLDPTFGGGYVTSDVTPG